MGMMEMKMRMEMIEVGIRMEMMEMGMGMGGQVGVEKEEGKERGKERFILADALTKLIDTSDLGLW